MRARLFRPAAAADIERAFAWNERERAGLGEEFLTELLTSVQAVADRPETYPVLHRQTRRALVRRFPYALFFRLLDERIGFVETLRRGPRQLSASVTLLEGQNRVHHV